MKHLLVLGSMFLIAVNTLDGQSLNKRMISAIRGALGDDLKGYKTYSYPTDNFGVYTCYEKKANVKNFVCDTWHCIGHDTGPTDPTTWLNVYGFAIVSGGGAIQLDQQTNRDYAFQVGLPKIADILNISAGFNKIQDQNVHLTLGKAYKRMWFKDSLINYFNTSTAQSTAKTDFEKGILRLVIGDVVIDNLSITVTLSDSTNIADVEAKVGTTNSKVFSDASLSVKVQRVSRGTYVFSIDHPFIFAVFSKRQPGAGALAANVDNWIPDSANFPKDPSLLKNRHPAH